MRGVLLNFLLHQFGKDNPIHKMTSRTLRDNYCGPNNQAWQHDPFMGSTTASSRPFRDDTGNSLEFSSGAVEPHIANVQPLNFPNYDAEVININLPIGNSNVHVQPRATAKPSQADVNNFQSAQRKLTTASQTSLVTDVSDVTAPAGCSGEARKRGTDNLDSVENSHQKKLKAYQKQPCKDKEEERKRVRAVTSKRHRDNVKRKLQEKDEDQKQIEKLQKELDLMTAERDQLKQVVENWNQALLEFVDFELSHAGK